MSGGASRSGGMMNTLFGGPEDRDPLDFTEDDRETNEDSDGKPKRPSRAARNSELHYLGREFFAPAGLQMRVEQLLWAYRQLKPRVRADQSLFARIDLSRVIVAGYDVGAQTAAAMVGESYAIKRPQNSDFKPQAAMLFSPYVDSAVGSSRQRYSQIDLPLLAVTGSEDSDPYGLGFAQGRTAIWEFAQPGGKYLLDLKNANHRLLSGGELAHRRRQSGLMGGGMRHGDYQDQGGPGGPPPDGIGRSGSRLQDEDMDYKHIAAILSTSVAFLDSAVKADSFAHVWLTGKKAKWLDKTATLKNR